MSKIDVIYIQILQIDSDNPFMEHTSTNIDLNKVKEYIFNADISEKLEIARFIDNITLTKRLMELSGNVKKIAITDEEIFNEVEAVRDWNFRNKIIS